MKCKCCGQEMNREDWLNARRSSIYRKAIDHLKETPSTIIKLSEDLDMGSSTIARALNELQNAGWVQKNGVAPKAYDECGRRAHIFGIIE